MTHNLMLFSSVVEHLHSEDERQVEEGEEEEEEDGDEEEDIYQLDLPSAELCADYWQIHKMVKVRRAAIGTNVLIGNFSVL
ncbi:hypothetical protein E2C01_097899 [Portunus trituberculatus]|uniref:Uncharacterized protein n=1 Tax=Portunus trituberculatus TaxID=210409 RepID=A0A5B7JWD6_PORTR|nr:hypothetical protein [Portunus trituberculatus]